MPGVDETKPFGTAEYFGAEENYKAHCDRMKQDVYREAAEFSFDEFFDMKQFDRYSRLMDRMGSGVSRASRQYIYNNAYNVFGFAMARHGMSLDDLLASSPEQKRKFSDEFMDFVEEFPLPEDEGAISEEKRNKNMAVWGHLYAQIDAALMKEKLPSFDVSFTQPMEPKDLARLETLRSLLISSRTNVTGKNRNPYFFAGYGDVDQLETMNVMADNIQEITICQQNRILKEGADSGDLDQAKSEGYKSFVALQTYDKELKSCMGKELREFGRELPATSLSKMVRDVPMFEKIEENRNAVSTQLVNGKAVVVANQPLKPNKQLVNQKKNISESAQEGSDMRRAERRNIMQSFGERGESAEQWQKQGKEAFEEYAYSREQALLQSLNRNLRDMEKKHFGIIGFHINSNEANALIDATKELKGLLEKGRVGYQPQKHEGKSYEQCIQEKTAALAARANTYVERKGLKDDRTEMGTRRYNAALNIADAAKSYLTPPVNQKKSFGSVEYFGTEERYNKFCEDHAKLAYGARYKTEFRFNDFFDMDGFERYSELHRSGLMGKVGDQGRPYDNMFNIVGFAMASRDLNLEQVMMLPPEQKKEIGMAFMDFVEKYPLQADETRGISQEHVNTSMAVWGRLYANIGTRFLREKLPQFDPDFQSIPDENQMTRMATIANMAMSFTNVEKGKMDNPYFLAGFGEGSGYDVYTNMSNQLESISHMAGTIATQVRVLPGAERSMQAGLAAAQSYRDILSNSIGEPLSYLGAKIPGSTMEFMKNNVKFDGIADEKGLAKLQLKNGKYQLLLNRTESLDHEKMLEHQQDARKSGDDKIETEKKQVKEIIEGLEKQNISAAEIKAEADEKFDTAMRDSKQVRASWDRKKNGGRRISAQELEKQVGGPERDKGGHERNRPQGAAAKEKNGIKAAPGGPSH